LPVERRSWEQIAGYRQNLDFYLAEAEQARPCWDVDLCSPLALIIGGEAEGAGSEARNLARANLVIPMPGGSESLNAAVAAGILMFEVVRQRRRGDAR
jgi:TrmH family RNA methyltransferase